MQDWGPGTVVAASSVLHLNLRVRERQKWGAGKLQAPVLNTLPPSPLAAPEGGGGHPQSAHTVPEIKASHCCGFEWRGGPSREAVMGMEEEAGSAWQQGGAERRVRGRVGGAGSRKGC